MKRKSTDYSGANSGGWLQSATDLFLAQWRGGECEICGKRRSFEDGRYKRSAGHHILFQSQSRAHKFSNENIILLCPCHHSKFERGISPHSITSTGAQERFAEWVKENKPEQYTWWHEHEDDEFDRFASESARDLYETLGGEVHSKTGLLKDMKPKNHRKNIIRTIVRCNGEDALSKQEKTEWDALRNKENQLNKRGAV